MRAAVAGVAAAVLFGAVLAPALGGARAALFVERTDEYGRPVSGPWLSLHNLAQATGSTFAYVGHPGSADFDYELARPTPVGSLVIDFHQNGVPSGAALHH